MKYCQCPLPRIKANGTCFNCGKGEAPADELDEILDKVYAAGLISGERYAEGKQAGTLTSDTLYEAKAALKKYTQDRIVAELEGIPLDNRGSGGVWLSMSLEERDRRIAEIKAREGL